MYVCTNCGVLFTQVGYVVVDDLEEGSEHSTDNDKLWEDNEFLPHIVEGACPGCGTKYIRVKEAQFTLPKPPALKETEQVEE